jgi:adenylate kinase
MKIILFGAPGSGKGTQASMLSKYLSLKKVSLEDILREEVKKDTSLGQQVKKYMEKGLLVPDELVSKVVEENINQEGFVLDGYPRNLNQALVLEEILKNRKQDINFFIYLDIDEKTIIVRLSKRRVCKKCGANYHLENMPPQKNGTCDTCKGELIQRKDDKSSVIKKRWEVFLKETEKILDFYQNKNKLIKIDGRGNAQEVFCRVKSRLQ